jgi:hypothetical protein
MALITATQIINTAFTNKNTDPYLCKDSFIEIAELNFIKPSIGKKLYNKINDDINSSVVWSDIQPCGVTLGSTTITCAANSFIKVGDFVSGIGLPILDNDDCGLNKILTVNVPGAVTSFTVSGKAIVTNAATTLTFDRPNGKLHNYIKDYLSFCVKFEMLPDMTYNTTSQGVVENVADFTVPVNAKKLSFLRSETYKKSETLLLKMTNFLSDNLSSFPDYCNENAGGVSKKNGIILY